MRRAFIVVLDSLGIGATEDAERFGDVGANTLSHITEACAEGEADSGRKGPLNLPNLTRLELAKAHEGFTGFIPVGMDGSAEVIGMYAQAHEASSGRDTPSGHREATGAPVLSEWRYFSGHEDNFPQEPLGKLVERANLLGYLGNCHSSGTVILGQLSKEHMKTDKPVLYTSADSMFWIACHEGTFGLDKLYELYEIAREELTNGGYDISRVIACSLIGDKAGSFQYTGNCCDLAIEPPAPTVLQRLADEEHGQAVSVGKIVDVYANCGITKRVEVAGPDALLDITIKEMKEVGDSTIVSTSFIDFGSSWGHRRDVTSYAAGLELFNHRLPELMSLLRDDDILIPTIDHGYDPTWTGTDRTRERIPILVYGPKAKPGPLGHRETFASIDQTLAKYFGTSDMEYDKTTFQWI